MEDGEISPAKVQVQTITHGTSYRGLTTTFYVRVEFANITAITERYRDNIEEMKENFARIHVKYVVGIEGKESWGFTPVPKYTHVSLFVTFNLRKLKQEG